MSLVFNRYEKKYILSIDTYNQIIDLLLENMDLDKNNKDMFNEIQSIYLDTPNDDYIRNSISKPYYKEKVRIRGYGKIDKETVLYLEVKRKVDKMVNKRRTEVHIDDVEYLLKNNKLKYKEEYMNKQVLDEINYILERDRLIPKLFVSYERCAITDKYSDLRITFDRNIVGSSNNIKFNTKGDKQLLDKNKMIMEIKTCFGMPRWLLDILEQYEIKRESFSKYGNSYKQDIENRKRLNYDFK